MTVDLFAASFICRDADFGALWQSFPSQPGSGDPAALHGDQAIGDAVPWYGTWLAAVVATLRRNLMMRPA